MTSSTLRNCVAWLPALALLLAVGASAAPDEGREQRWATQVAPQVVVGDVEWLATPQGARVFSIYTPASAATKGAPEGAALVLHGAGVHPDFGMIGSLRTALADHGVATLSVQMPVLAADAPRTAYAQIVPLAGERIAAGVTALRSKGFSRIAIVAHSMGATMADTYLARSGVERVDAWVVVGMLIDFTATPGLPVLDVVAERDFPEVLSAAKLRAPRLPRDGCSRATVVPATDHYFGDAAAGAALARDTAAFLTRVFATAGCAGKT